MQTRETFIAQVAALVRARLNNDDVRALAHGTRGGKSKGPGSGSRLNKVCCETCGYTARVSRKWLDVGAPHCPDHGAMQEE